MTKKSQSTVSGQLGQIKLAAAELTRPHDSHGCDAGAGLGCSVSCPHGAEDHGRRGSHDAKEGRVDRVVSGGHLQSLYGGDGFRT